MITNDWTKSLPEILVHSLTSHSSNFNINLCLSKILSEIEIFMAVDHPQRKSRAICNFIIRDENRIKIILYVLKIAYIDVRKLCMILFNRHHLNN